MKIINRYIRDIKYSLPIVSSSEKKYLQILKSDLIRYKESNPSFSYEDLIEEFGYPKDIAASYINEQSNDYMLKHIKTKKIIKYTCLIVISIALLIGLWKGYLYYKGYQEAQSQNITHFITTPPEEISNEKISD